MRHLLADSGSVDETVTNMDTHDMRLRVGGKDGPNWPTRRSVGMTGAAIDADSPVSMAGTDDTGAGPEVDDD